MTFPEPTNFTGVFGKLIEYPTVVTDYWFPRLFLLGLLFILTGTMLRYKLNRAFASSIFICSLLAILLWFGDVLQTIDIYIAIIGVGLGAVGLIIKRN